MEYTYYGILYTVKNELNYVSLFGGFFEVLLSQKSKRQENVYNIIPFL